MDRKQQRPERYLVCFCFLLVVDDLLKNPYQVKKYKAGRKSYAQGGDI
jgi:hypothetical protein